MNYQILFLSTIFLLFLSCTPSAQHVNQNIQEKNKSTIHVGGPLENPEFTYIDMPEMINHIDTSAGWSQAGQKILITGTILKKDGLTPAPNVILYYYHTTTKGLYESNENLNPKVARHGYIRSWVKSNKLGQYSIYTVRPGTYPNLGAPAHIHTTIIEPKMNEYYIDEFIFDDDPLITEEYEITLKNRGGSGIMHLEKSQGLFIAKHDIILGLNIPDYPTE